MYSKNDEKNIYKTIKTIIDHSLLLLVIVIPTIVIYIQLVFNLASNSLISLVHFTTNVSGIQPFFKFHFG